MSCDIIIPVWNLLEKTKDCIESVIKYTQFPYRIIVVDNGSCSPTKEYLQSLKQKNDFKYSLIRNETNLGNTKAANQGIKGSSAEYVCILDNDTIVTRGWLREMVKIAESSADIGIVNPSSNSLGRNPKGKSPEAIHNLAEELKRNLAGQYTEMATAVGFCYLIKRKVIEKIGLWDEDFSPGYYEDSEYSLRAQKAGFRSVCASGAYVYHRESASFKRLKSFNKLFERSRQIFYQKCGKPKRILYVLSGSVESKIMDQAYNSAKLANWVWIFIKASQLNRSKTRFHSQIRLFTLPDGLYWTNCLWRTLKRQKKKFDQIFCDNLKFVNLLKRLRPVHKAEIILLDYSQGR